MAALRMLAVLVAVISGLLDGASAVAAPATADGRNFEMVSPVDKNGGDVAGDNVSIVSSADGNAVTYLSRGSFGDTVGSGAAGQTQYVAERGSDGWTNHSITPTPRFDATQITVTSTALLGFSDDLRRAVVWGYDLPGVPGAIPQTPNIYSEDVPSRMLELVTKPSGPVNPFLFLLSFAGPDPAGVSRDSRHIAFRSLAPLLPGAPLGVPSVYEWDNGTLRLASVLPDDTIATAGAMLATRAYRETVSPDGSRVTFVSPPDPTGQLYMRIEHSHTAWVSEPETSGSPPTPQDVVLQEVTGDSRHVIFATSSRLLDEDPNDGSDLYLYTDSSDPANDANLRLITSTGDVPGNDPFAGTAVIGSSQDARRIYYYRNEHIVLWENGATTAVADDVSPADAGGLRFAATVAEPGGARVSPDGRYLAFMTAATPTRNGAPVATPDGHVEMYLYDARDDSLRCVSCPSSGLATADASVVPSVTHIDPSLSSKGARPSYLAYDGRTFFSTAEALVTQDVNGVVDAYEFDPNTGQVVLLSTGKGSEPASFADASLSGRDAFIVTRQRLVRADRDSLVDLYDIRVGGGFPEPQEPAPPCEGETCQGSIAPEPVVEIPGTLHVEAGARSVQRIRIARQLSNGAHARVRIVLPVAGTVTWRGRRLRHGSRVFSTAGAHTIEVTLTPRARRALRHRGVRVVLRLTFNPFEGPTSSIRTSLAFDRSSKKGQ